VSAAQGGAERAARLDAATAHLDAPFAVVDLDAFDANAADLHRRAGRLPIRVASKSVRVRALIDRAGASEGFAGVMTFALREAIWLARHGHRDLLMGYPSVDRGALAELAGDPELCAAITLMVDDPAQLDVLDTAAPGRTTTVRVCLDVDASLRIGPVHLGVRRSPVHTPEQAGAAAAVLGGRAGVELVGVMFYDAQIAGLPDTRAAVRWVKARSAADLATRRSAVLESVRAASGVVPALVNAGGTGSLEVDGADRAVTELTAGSGLFASALFDGYRSFAPAPAAWFALPVVRRPHPRIVTAFSGGYSASGPAGRSRLPTPTWPRGLRLIGSEGAGEVQTPVRGAVAAELRIGDRVWFRHAKAGEMCERFDAVHLVSGGQVVDTFPTYRGEGHTFG
jgi:D-serine deaminase-like pyridoxal phosphate-dependent protein